MEIEERAAVADVKRWNQAVSLSLGWSASIGMAQTWPAGYIDHAAHAFR